jgi:2-C-methyl-D-erythritol 4-phosphate cytidylyltransferase
LTSVWAIVVAAGRGERFGGRKQYDRLGDRRVLDWSLHAARAVAAGVVLVVAAEEADRSEPAADAVVTGGATRAASVRAGLAAVPDDADVVVVHDAARPLAPAALFESVVAAVRSGADGAIPGVPVADTLKQVREGVVAVTVDRRELVAVQTPQAFRAEVLRRAHDGAPDATDDAGLVEAIGGKVVVVEGDPRNRKLTTPDDLLAARALVEGEA